MKEKICIYGMGAAMQNGLSELEIGILLWIQENLRFSFLNPIMQFITSLGDKGFFWILLCILLVAFKKTRRIGIMAAVALALNALIVNVILKTQIMRIRPFMLEEGLSLITRLPKDSSFPSGHTSASFATAVILFKGLPKYVGIPALTLAFLIGFSRLYVGAHFPTDVLAGAIIGTIVAWSVWWYFKKYVYKDLDRLKK
ncbi:MAG: phosphatase PAP2 family protein [Roseburia sp.]|nr:phosphatase PAP2 family protein [Roseburia sp.]MCM1277808.1 phosphatase PAP2 family protein [Robinsoniella sp.]